MARTPIPSAELTTWLSKHPTWKVEEGQLVRTFEAPSFRRAIAFVGEVAQIAEAVDHHPDIDIRWKKVTLRFVTHDAGPSITELDTRQASECDLLFAAAP